MNIVIEPFMLMLPTGTDLDEKTIMNYVNGLENWGNEFRQTDQYLISDLACASIDDCQLWPTVPGLQALLRRYLGRDAADMYPVDAYVRVINGIRDLTPKVEDKIKYPFHPGANCPGDPIFNDFAVLPDSGELVPEEMRKRMEPAVQDFITSLILTGYSRSVHADASTWSIAAAPLKTDQSQKITVRSKVLEPIDGDIGVRDYKYDWPLLFRPEYIYAAMEVTDYFLDDPYLATDIAWCQLKAKGEKLKGIDRSQFTFREEFIKSLEESRIKRRQFYKRDIQTVFEVIVKILENKLEYGSDKNHALRKIVDLLTSPQITRTRKGEDGQIHEEGARRAHVTEEPIGKGHPLRLHYWKCYNEILEFANITDNHPDSTIKGQ